jgi:hypothetical protein
MSAKCQKRTLAVSFDHARFLVEFRDRERGPPACVPEHQVPGSTIPIAGTQFNGLSQAVGYGDDGQ